MTGSVKTVDEQESTATSPDSGDGPETGKGLGHKVFSGLDNARLLFRAFRRTRPFWGGLWTMLAGIWIIRAMNFGIGMAITGGWNYSAGYTLGGALVLFGATAWVAPHYKSLVGIMAFAVALIAFVAANLGGYLVGTLLGILGGSMIWAWGEKSPKRDRGRRSRAKAASEPEGTDG